MSGPSWRGRLAADSASCSQEEEVLEETLHTCEVGLLRGRGVTLENLSAVGEQVLVDLIEPLEKTAATQGG